MGASTSKEEKKEGSAVTAGDNKITMPNFARAEQLPTGSYPGNTWQKKSPPEGLLKALEDQGVTALYEEYKAAVIKDGNGTSIMGWNSAKIYKVTQEFQPKFKAKGVDLYYCTGSVWRYNGSGSQQEWFYYIVFAAPGPMDKNWVPENVYKGK